MEEEDLVHGLRVLVELDLYKRVTTIKEGNFQNTKEMIEETIKSFERTLPEWTKQISDCHSIIIDTLKRTETEKAKINQSYKQENNKEKDER